MMKIALVMTSLNTGGIATSVVNLLNEISKDDNCSADLILFHKRPKDIEILPDNIEVLSPGKWAELIAISSSEAKKMGRRYLFLRYILGGICKVFGHGLAYKLILTFSKKYHNYDVAVSCTQSAPLRSLYGGCNEFVLHNIDSKKKIAYIHCDYVAYGINDRYSHNIYKCFDKIAVVSDSVGRVFLSEEPNFKEKTFTVRNCHNLDKIMELSKENTAEFSKDELNIITVARLSKEKGHMRVLGALKVLKDNNIKFKWHLIGGDKDRCPLEFKKKISEYGLDDYVIFHGIQHNPYRFMVNADFLLLPSYHEAAPMVFDEARLLQLPVLTTKTVSAVEMVEALNIGLVCENDDKDLANAVYYLATHREVLSQYKENCARHPMDNKVALEQFMNMIGDSL